MTLAEWTADGDPLTPTAPREGHDRDLARGLLDAWPGPVCVVDSQSRIVAVNRAWDEAAEDNGGTAQACGIGAHYLDTCERAALQSSGLDSVDAALVAQGIGQVLAGTLDHFSHDYACPSPSGNRWFTVRVTPATIADAAGAVIAHLDITERCELQRSLERQSLHDPLTGLPRWALMLDRLEQAVRTSPRHGVAVTVISLSLQPSPDADVPLGSHDRESVMVQVGERLQARLRPGDTVSRSARDTFAVLWSDVDAGRPPEAVALSKDLLLALDAPFDTARSRVRADAHAGVALHAPGQGVEDLLRAADAAVQEAKALGPGRVVLSTDRATPEPTFRTRLTVDLRRALTEDSGQFVLHYQPIVDLATGDVVAVEALVRWQHPTWGLLGPDRFVPLAESAGLIHRLGTWVLEQALRDAVNLTHEGRDLDVAVNLSVRQLDEQAATTVQRALEEGGVRPDRLVLEVTDWAFAEEEDTTASTIEALSRLGVKIAVDDFGTGYSSLLYVHRFPINSLKLDREFVAGIGISAEDEAICTSIVDLAAAVGASTVAEGVETVEQHAFLRSLGCTQAQGFLWSPAVPLDTLRLALTSCDQVSVTAPASPTALQRRRVDENRTALRSKRKGERGSSLKAATALEGAATRPDGTPGTDSTWAPPAPGAPDDPSATDAAPLVLLCEDAGTVRRLMRTQLELAGFAVEEAADGHAAMGLLIQPELRRPDVIVVDCQQEPYDSWWAIAAIRAHPALDHTPALLVTADPGDRDNVQADEAGFDGLITRPVVAEDLVRTVELLAATGRQPHRQPRASALSRARDRRAAKRSSGRRQPDRDPAAARLRSS